MSTDAVPTYPATFQLDAPERIARWRVIGNIVLAIPHFIVVYILNLVAQVLALVAWILGVFTGKVPVGILDIIAMCVRYSTRTTVYASFLVEDYPPFTFNTTTADPGDYPRVRVDFVPETEGRNRLTIFFRIFLLIPHIIALYVLGFIGFFVYVIAWFAVLFTGRWPVGLRNYIVGLTRWSTRFSAYAYLLTDEFPPFSLT